MKSKGKKTKINKESNHTLKKLYLDKGITACEVGFTGCWGNRGLSWHHRHKRRWYGGQTYKLSEFKQTLLVCIVCHGFLEESRQLSEETFLRLRGIEE